MGYVFPSPKGNFMRAQRAAENSGAVKGLICGHQSVTISWARERSFPVLFSQWQPFQLNSSILGKGHFLTLEKTHFPVHLKVNKQTSK